MERNDALYVWGTFDCGFRLILFACTQVIFLAYKLNDWLISDLNIKDGTVRSCLE